MRNNDFFHQNLEKIVNVIFCFLNRMGNFKFKSARKMQNVLCEKLGLGHCLRTLKKGVLEPAVAGRFGGVHLCLVRL